MLETSHSKHEPVWFAVYLVFVSVTNISRHLSAANNLWLSDNKLYVTMEIY